MKKAQTVKQAWFRPNLIEIEVKMTTDSYNNSNNNSTNTNGQGLANGKWQGGHDANGWDQHS